jgi:hypothetical protein
MCDVIITDPMESLESADRFEQLTNSLSEIFNLFAHVQQTKEGFCSVYDAFKNAFAISKKKDGIEALEEEANKYAKSRTRTLQRQRGADNIRKHRFRFNEVFVMQFGDLSSQLLQDKKLRWYRDNITTITSNVLLPSEVVHVSLRTYLCSIKAKICPSIVASILGVPKDVAERIVPDILANREAKSVQCVHIIQAKDKTASRRCKKRIKNNFSHKPPLCNYHRMMSNVVL